MILHKLYAPVLELTHNYSILVTTWAMKALPKPKTLLSLEAIC